MEFDDIKPREQWDEDERHDGRAKTAKITVLVFVPGGGLEIRVLPNTLDAMREVVGGTICTFQTGINGTIGVCNDEGLLLGFPPCRYIAATGALIFGTFFVAGDGVNMHSLTPEQILEGMQVLGPPLTLFQVYEALRREDETMRLIEEWNNEPK